VENLVTDHPIAVRAVLLDIDGTLVDSNDAHARSWIATLAESRIDRRFHEVRPLIGMGGDKLLPALTGIASDSDRGREIAARRWERFAREYLPSLRAFEGVDAMLARFRAEKRKIVVATSASDDEARALLRVAAAEWLMPDATSSSDAESSKPDPDIVHAALERARTPAAAAVMIGDTPYDIEAAARAGVRAIAFRCGGWWSAEDLAGAVAQFAGPAELLARYVESPLAPSGEPRRRA
jgi:HAD superfamily hydrolase (TIGR01549 family)